VTLTRRDVLKGVAGGAASAGAFLIGFDVGRGDSVSTMVVLNRSGRVYGMRAYGAGFDVDKDALRRDIYGILPELLDGRDRADDRRTRRKIHRRIGRWCCGFRRYQGMRRAT
jgi:hypothetical protein